MSASVSVLAHSLGNFVAVEALRQMAIRNRGLSPKIKDIMLASPDIDVDVFRRQIAEIEKDAKSPPITLFVSQDDKALGLSSLIAGDEPRIGAVNPLEQPFRGILEQGGVHVVDLTLVAAADPVNHEKFADHGRRAGDRRAARFRAETQRRQVQLGRSGGRDCRQRRPGGDRRDRQRPARGGVRRRGEGCDALTALRGHRAGVNEPATRGTIAS